MRFLALTLPAVSLVLALCGCHDNSLPADGNDLAAAPDLGVLLDLARGPDLVTPPDLFERPDFTSVNCGNRICDQGQLCCLSFDGQQVLSICAASCDADGGVFPLLCDGPDTCPGGNPCCVDLLLAGGVPMTRGTHCEQRMDACPFSFNLQTLSFTTRLCHFDNDCGAGQFLGQPLKCCSVANQPAHFCAGPLMMLGVNITCP